MKSEYTERNVFFSFFLMRLLSIFLLAVCSVGCLLSAQETEVVFDPNQYDIHQIRITSWDEDYRAVEIKTPEELPEFLKPIRDMYLAEAVAFLEEETDYDGEFRQNYKEEIDKHFRLLARYHYLQLEYGEYCFGTQKPAELEQYRREIQEDTTRLALQMLKGCVWSSACVWTHSDIENHPVDKQLAALPERPNFGEVALLNDYLSYMLEERARYNSDIRMYGGAMDDIRAARMFMLVDELADLHYYTCDNTLAFERWSEQDLGKKAASILIQQFDALRHLMCNAIEWRFYVPDGMIFYVGSMYSPNVELFYAHQEAFLYRAFNFAAHRKAPADSAKTEDVKPEPQTPAEPVVATPAEPVVEKPVIPAESPAPTTEGNSTLLWLIAAPVWAVVFLLLGVFLGCRMKCRQ